MHVNCAFSGNKLLVRGVCLNLNIPQNCYFIWASPCSFSCFFCSSLTWWRHRGRGTFSGTRNRTNWWSLTTPYPLRKRWLVAVTTSRLNVNVKIVSQLVTWYWILFFLNHIYIPEKYFKRKAWHLTTSFLDEINV